VIRLTLETGETQRFETANDAVTFLKTLEGLQRGELEWVRVQLRYELRVDVTPPITKEEYTLEIDTNWLEDSARGASDAS
jgi:hypothetical protein